MNNENLPRLFSLTQMGIATFLGSAIAAGYMLAQNYAALGKPRLGMYSLAGSIAIVAAMTLVPVNALASPTTAVMVMVGQIFVVLIAANQLQGKMLASFREMGGSYHTMLRTVVVGIVASMVFTFAFLFLILVLGGPLPEVVPTPTSEPTGLVAPGHHKA